MAKVKIKSHLKQITPRIRQQVNAAIRATAFYIEAEAKLHCPVDTGNLRASIQTVELSEGRYAVGTNVEYAVYQEFGTHKQAAQPFFTPAVEKGRRYLLGELKKLKV